MHNLYHMVEYSSINSRNWTRYERRHPASKCDSWRSTANKDFTNWKRL